MMYNLITGVYNLLINKSLAETLKKNLELVGPPQFTQEEQTFAKELQKTLGKEQDGLSTKIEEYAEATWTSLSAAGQRMSAM